MADSCTIHLDRRLTRGETADSAVAEIQALESVRGAGATVTVLEYARPAYTGLTYPTRKYYPTWVLEEREPAVAAAVAAAGQALGARPVVGRWNFSTNAVATRGMFGVPTVGFGPGERDLRAHPGRPVPGRPSDGGRALLRDVPAGVRRGDRKVSPTMRLDYLRAKIAALGALGDTTGTTATSC